MKNTTPILITTGTRVKLSRQLDQACMREARTPEQYYRSKLELSRFTAAQLEQLFHKHPGLRDELPVTCE